MEKRVLVPNTDLSVYPIGLGTVDAGLRWDGADADKIFDTYLGCGGNIIDCAHVYSDWVPGEIARAERVLGDWLQRSGKRNEIVLITKGGHPDMTGENPDTHISRMTHDDMVSDLNASLKQLRTDVIDIYFLPQRQPQPVRGGGDRDHGGLCPRGQDPLLRLLQLGRGSHEGR